jgi:hypothetical protein
MDALIADIEAVRAHAQPQARRRFELRRAGLAAILLLSLTAAGLTLSRLERLGWWQDPWAASPALSGMGLDVRTLHAAEPGTEDLVRRALESEAQGDLPRALALLESAHRSDNRTPIPAILMSYWGRARMDAATAQAWRDRAAQRLESIDDPVVHLFDQFTQTDAVGNYEEALNYAAALLELRPKAWYLHLARAHMLNFRGLRVAALRELQQIDSDRLDHRKLVDAIADRASLGDLAGAQAIAARLQVENDDGGLALLQARLAYSGGDLALARDRFRDSVAMAQAAARFDIEARGLLYQGVIEGALGNHAAAEPLLRLAKQRLLARHQNRYAIDALLALAQIAALRDDTAGVEREIEEARALDRIESRDDADPMIALYTARLLHRRSEIQSRGDEALDALLRARDLVLTGEAEAARRMADLAEARGIGQSHYVEEFALLRHELGQSLPELSPIDPPFGPYSRFASRWVLGRGASVAPGRP